MKGSFQKFFFGIISVVSVLGQDGGDCLTGDTCGDKDPCCSRFGFCGEDAGYCYPIEGCILRGVEIEGGDLTAAEGGGGVDVERGQLDGCAYICEENSLCGWYTYDKSANKCYLKGERGYLSNKTDTANIVSGATTEDGCTFNPREEGLPDVARQPGRPGARQPNRRRRRRRCQYPFIRRGNRCIHYCQANQQWGINQSNNRRSFFNSKLLCNEHDSKLPYSLEESGPEGDFGNDWHWLAYPPKEDQCLAVRPSRYEEGAAYFPCAYKFNFACEMMDWNGGGKDQSIGNGRDRPREPATDRERAPKLSFPTIQVVSNISQYNYEFQRQQCNTCQGGGSWIPNYSNNNNYGGCGLNSCDRGLSGYNGVGYNNGYNNGYNSGFNPYNNLGNNFNTNGCSSCNQNSYYGNNGGRGNGGNGGRGNGFNNYDYNNQDYGYNGRDYGYNNNNEYDDFDYDYGGGGGGRRGGGGGGGIISVGGGTGGGGGSGGGGARRQKPSKFLQRRRQEIQPIVQSNPYVSLMG